MSSLSSKQSPSVSSSGPKRKKAVKTTTVPAAARAASASATSAAVAASPFSRRSRGAVRVRRTSQTQKYQQALAKFLSTSQSGKRLSRTTSTRSVSKSKVRRPSLPNLFPKSKSPTGTPKGNLDQAAIEKLITSIPEDKRKELFIAINEIRLEQKRKFKLPIQNLADPEEVKKFEGRQRKAREARAKKDAATDELILKGKEADFKKFEKDLKEFKKKHHQKTSQSLDLESTFRPFILTLPQLVPPDKEESEMTPAEKAYKKKYEDLNKEIQDMVKQLHESKKVIEEKEASLERKKRESKPLTALEARRKLEKLEQERVSQAAAEFEKSKAEKAERLKRENAAEAAQKLANIRQARIMRHPSEGNTGPGEKMTLLGKKRRSKKGSKKKTRGASKKKVGGYSNSNKPNNYGSYP